MDDVDDASETAAGDSLELDNSDNGDRRPSSTAIASSPSSPA
jgi:hypothetical protein